MSSVESGRIGPKLVSSPNPQPDENPETVCYCPECGARVRVVSREHERHVDRGTLPDWLPESTAAPTAMPSDAQAEPPTPVMSPVAPEPATPALAALPLLATRPSLPPIPSLPPVLSLAAPGISEEDDEPTRVFADYGTASASSPQAAQEQPATDVRHHTPHPPIRQHVSDSVSRLQAHSVPVDSGPQQASEVAPAVAASSSSAELPQPTTANATVEEAPALPAAAVEPPPPADAYPGHVGVQSTSPTARDVELEASEQPVGRGWSRHKVLLFSAGLGGVALGLVLSVRGPAPTRAPAAAAIPVAAIAASKDQPSTASAAAATPAATEALEQLAPTASAVSAKPAKTKSLAAAAREIEHSPSAAPKNSVSAVTKPVAQEPKDEPADEEEPFDAREAARAMDEAAERASSCRRENDPSGVAVVTITFAPSGRVTTATLAGPPFLGTPTGSCIASTMRSARVSPFSGNHVTVRKTVTVH